MLNVLTVVLPRLAARPSLRAAWRHRVDALRDGVTTAPWISYRRAI
ncbi:hypothetical protein GTY54_42310 [Streptomyces sp. SID625]|nr:hypothetical protein [Streptomyces sp. SID625]